MFGSLASSAFLIYLDPQAAANTTRTLTIAHLIAAPLGLLTSWIFGHGYLAAGSAMIGAILLMILFDVTHPPAIATALSFALRSDAGDQIALFALALLLVVALALLQRAILWLIVRLTMRHADRATLSRWQS